MRIALTGAMVRSIWEATSILTRWIEPINQYSRIPVNHMQVEPVLYKEKKAKPVFVSRKIPRQSVMRGK